MKTFCCLRPLFTATLTTAALFAAGCGVVQRVPPGQSVAIAMAKKAELVTLPPTGNQTVAPRDGTAPPEPALPARPSEIEQIADNFTLGNFCMMQGQYAEAIAAYETTVRLSPNFADAWSKLAVAYQNTGQDKKALYAFRKSKSAFMP